MCFNCKKDTKQVSVKLGYCNACVKAYNEGIKVGEQRGYSEGYDDGASDMDF